MKLTASLTYVTPEGDQQVTSTKDFGDLTPEQERNAVFLFVSHLPNDVPSGATLRALSVTRE